MWDSTCWFTAICAAANRLAQGEKTAPKAAITTDNKDLKWIIDTKTATCVIAYFPFPFCFWATSRLNITKMSTRIPLAQVIENSTGQVRCECTKCFLFFVTFSPPTGSDWVVCQGEQWAFSWCFFEFLPASVVFWPHSSDSSALPTHSHWSSHSLQNGTSNLAFVLSRLGLSFQLTFNCVGPYLFQLKDV